MHDYFESRPCFWTFCTAFLSTFRSRTKINVKMHEKSHNYLPFSLVYGCESYNSGLWEKNPVFFQNWVMAWNGLQRKKTAPREQCKPACLFVRMSICPFVRMPICPLCVCPFVRLSICLYICLSIDHSIFFFLPSFSMH